MGRFWVPSHVLRAKGGRVAHSSPWLKPVFPCTAPGPSFYQRSVMTSGRYVASLVTFPLAPTLWGRHYQDVLQGGQIHGAPICLGKEATPGIRVKNQGEKDRFCIAHPAMRSPFHHFPKEAALQVQKVTPQSLLLTPIALGLPSFSL